MNELENQFKQIDNLKNELIEYYCEDQSMFNFDDFMRLFYDFCANINRVKEVSLVYSAALSFEK